MAYNIGVYELAHDLAAIIDRQGFGGDRAGDINLGKCAVFYEKTVDRLDAWGRWFRGILKVCHDLTAIIDPDGLAWVAKRHCGLPGYFNLCESAFIKQKAMDYAASIQEKASDLATIVDPGGLGSNGASEISITRENPILQEKAMKYPFGILEMRPRSGRDR